MYLKYSPVANIHSHSIGVTVVSGDTTEGNRFVVEAEKRRKAGEQLKHQWKTGRLKHIKDCLLFDNDEAPSFIVYHHAVFPLATDPLIALTNSLAYFVDQSL